MRNLARFTKTSFSKLQQRNFNTKQDPLDVLIVGGGITGSALLFELAAFTDLKRIGLVERASDYALISSGPNNNSQTIHCGDIETNYSLAKAKAVKRYADMLRNYATKLPEDMRDQCIAKMPKMVLAVGEMECENLAQRFSIFKDTFPNMKFMSKAMLREIEPNVVKLNSRETRLGPVNAIAIANEYSAVNYYSLTQALIKQAEELGKNSASREIHAEKNTEVLHIVENNDQTYSVITNRGTFHTRYLVVSACGYSLFLAQKLGYGLHYSVLPVAGSFYLAHKQMLKGKVYTVQDSKLPFAAVHGDPDLVAGGRTRFGPTALPVAVLERGNYRSILDFLKCAQVDANLVLILSKFMLNPTMLGYFLKNLLFDLPAIGPRLFLKDVQKVVPSAKLEDIAVATGWGGVRPQLINKNTGQLILGEGKIVGDRATFNITPSPGGTTCLGNAETDMRRICSEIGGNINEKAFSEYMLQGEYPVTL